MSKEYDFPSRRELTQRALSHLTQAETRLDAASPIQNALLGIGYAILSNAAADDIRPQPEDYYYGDDIARTLDGTPSEPLDWDYLRG